MALEKHAVQLNFAKGLDQKTDPLQVKPDKFLGSKNRVFNKMGRSDKRNGYGAYGTGVATVPNAYGFSQIPSNVAAGRNVSTFNGELVIADNLNLYSYSTTPNNWVYKGRVELCSTSSQSIYKNQNNNLTQDSALNSTLGINVFSWESWTADPRTVGTLNSVQIAAVDQITGQTIFSGSLASNTSRPKCVSISNKLYVLYFNSSNGHLFAQPVTQAGFGVAVDLISDINATTPNYDVIVNNSLIYISYCGTGTTVKVASFSSVLAAVATVSKAETATNGVGIFSDASNNLWIPYNNGSATKAFIMDSALAVTILAPTVVDAGAAASGVLNVTGIHDGTRGIIFYDKPGLPILGQFSFATNATFTQPAVGSSVNPGRFPTTDAFGIVYINTGGYYYVEAPISTAIAVYPIVNLGYAGNAAPGASIVNPQDVFSTAGYQNAIVTSNTLTAAGVVGTPATFNRSVALGSKAFLVNGVAHVVLTHDAPLQPTYFVGALYNTQSPVPNAAIVAKIAESQGGGIPYRSLLPAVNVVSAGIFQCALSNRTFSLERTSVNVPHVFFFLGITSFGMDFTTDDIQTNELGNNLQIGSGDIIMYDGANVVEQGFHLYPEAITAVHAASGGLSAGLYGYQVLYEWIDNQGQTHRSAPSPVVSITTLVDEKVTLTIPTLRITEKKTVTIAVYRTLVNGSIYFRVDTMSLSYPINNSTNSDTVTFVDAAADVDITGNEQLYTGQEVENIAAPGANAITEYKNRLIIIPSENPFVWEFSKQVVSGSPVEFSDLFQQNMTTVGGELKGAAKLDDKIIFLKGASLYYVTGTGPSPNGANNDFSDAQFITADAGLQDLRSVVSTPVGLMFKSSKGIYLLDRSLQTRYIGKAVEDYNAFTVRGAQLIPKGNQVRFILSNGTLLMYDYFWTDEEGIGQWTVFDNVDAVSDCIFQNLHTYITSSGIVYQETPGVYLDGVVPVNTYFKSAWFNLAGLQGFERAYYFYLLAQYISAHTLTLNIYYDYDATTIAQTMTITPVAGELEQWRIFLTLQKCQAFQIELQESGSNGAGLSMSGLNLVVGLKKGYTTIRAANSTS